jgi:hypothetical protein
MLNSEDPNKPISTATQAALDLKVTGPASSIANEIPRYSDTAGKIIKASGITISDSGIMSNLADPVNPSDAVNKSHLDAAIATASAGLFYKTPVRVASTANVTISSPGTSIDGVTLSSGDRVLLKNQSTGSQNGIYVFNGSGSSMTRATDADTSAEVKAGIYVVVNEGTRLIYRPHWMLSSHWMPNSQHLPDSRPLLTRCPTSLVRERQL